MVEIESQSVAEMNDGGMGFPFFLAWKGGRKHKMTAADGVQESVGSDYASVRGKGNTLTLPCRNPPFRRDAREKGGRWGGRGTGVCNLTESLHIEWVHRGSAL